MLRIIFNKFFIKSPKLDLHESKLNINSFFVLQYTRIIKKSILFFISIYNVFLFQKVDLTFKSNLYVLYMQSQLLGMLSFKNFSGERIKSICADGMNIL